MSRGKKFVLAFAVFLIAAITALLFYSDRMIAGIVGKAYDLDITYRGCSKSLSAGLVFRDLSIVSRPTGMGIISKRATIRPFFSNNKLMIDFNLLDVNFMKRAKDEPMRYDTLTALVSSPFSSRWRYSHIRGRVVPAADGIQIKNFDALSGNIRLSLNGEFFYKGLIESNIVIYFAAALTDKIPPELANVILANEGSGWRSLSVRLSGDPNKPSMQVSGRLFRLNIKAASGT